MSTLWLLALGLGSPAVGLLIGRRLASDDVAGSMRRHHQALAVLAEMTRGGAARQ